MDVPNVNTVIRRVEFDPGKDVINSAKHGCSFVEALALDWHALLVIEDRRMSYGEPRWRDMSLIRGRLYCVVFTIPGDAIRVIILAKGGQTGDPGIGDEKAARGHSFG